MPQDTLTNSPIETDFRQKTRRSLELHERASRVMRPAWITIGRASARATMAAWEPMEPSSSTTAVSDLP